MSKCLSCKRMLFTVMLITATMAWCGAAFATEQPGDPAIVNQLRSLKITDIRGKTYRPFARSSEGDSPVNAVAVVFVSTDCPIANSFQPWLKEIHEKFASQGVLCVQVHSSTTTTAVSIRQHISDYKVNMPVVLDDKQRLARLTNATTTPEAIVIDARGQIRYRGLINNLYAGFGKKRRKPTEQYLRDALSAVVDGREVETTQTKPVGCTIHYANE